MEKVLSRKVLIKIRWPNVWGQILEKKNYWKMEKNLSGKVLIN